MFRSGVVKGIEVLNHDHAETLHHVDQAGDVMTRRIKTNNTRID